MKVVVEADGGSRGNPGPAGYGAVVVDAATGAVLAERCAGIGEATNNVAEYRGLIAGLAAARELGAADVEVRMDSKLVVEQMSGRWQIKHAALQPLAREAAGLAAEVGAVRYTWVPRAQNGRADALANRAMDEQAGVGAAGRAPGARADAGGAAASAPGDGVSPVSGARADGDVDGPASDAGGGAAKPASASASWTGQVGVPTRMLLLRHGQTALSIDRRYSGHGDPALTELGERQAAGAAKRLGGVPGIAAILTSPLRRARQTADAVAAATGAPVEVRPRLIETDFGAWEGLTFAEAKARDPQVHAAWLGDEHAAPPGGESFAAVGARVEEERRAIVAEHPGELVVVVSHVTPIKMLLRSALDGGSGILYRLHLDLAALSEAHFYPDGGASVRLVNDTSHNPRN